jgi:hypothetical protein
MATRDTDYATELVTASYPFPESDGAESRAERLYIKSLQQEAIRFSWWKDGRMMMRPLDIREGELLGLLREALSKGVFSDEFLVALRELLDSRSTQT